MSADACVDSFAFFSSEPLVVQQPPAHRLLVVLPVRRDCCSWSCESSARVTYFTALTSTSLQPARAGVDFVESRGAVLFGAGQQRAQLAVEVLPALVDDWKVSEEPASEHQRAFAVILEAPVNAPTTQIASTEIVVEPFLASKSANASTTSTRSALYAVVGVLTAGLVVLIVWWFRARHCRLPQRRRTFEYKVLFPRRNSGASMEALVSSGCSTVKKSGMRRMARRVSSFKSWRVVIEQQRKREVSDRVSPEIEDLDLAGATNVDDNEPSTDSDDDSESERELREHLASIQSLSPV
ncbi:hypothetical protein PHMEG_00026271 [Phytophthora megakarya]|uniref:Transmembrane protein n=1 Tax=Phytophthora megakarya TaxID=4795 RepID=A0A225VBD5_9STRA|nr:hypothetical protein PHMEG_00026271 [Phytophthora megakarya]